MLSKETQKMRKNKSQRITRLSAALMALSLYACDNDEVADEGGTEMGGAPVAGEVEGGSGGSSAGGDGGGVSAGVMAGEAGVMGGAPGGAQMQGRFDPNEPLPEPKATTLSVPESIAEPRDGAANSECSGSWVEEARGWVVDELGAPLEGAKVQLCVRVAESGALLCLIPSDSSADGSFRIDIPVDARCMAEATFRSLIPRERFATAYCHAEVSAVSDDAALRINEPFVLYQTRPALSQEAGAELYTSSFAGDVSVSFNADDLYGPQADELWARSLAPNAPGLCFLEADGPQIDAVFAFSPEGDLSGSNAAVVVPNSAGYEPMTELALYALGNLDCSVVGQDEGIEEGAWVQVGTATVDATGARIEASAAQGLPCLNWFGYGPLP